jgi:hypothetical protein
VTRRPTRGAAVLVALVVAVVLSLGMTVSRGAPADAAPARPEAPLECDPATATDGLLPDGCYGPYPVHNYDINYSSGHFWEVDRNFVGMMTQIAFDVGTWFVRLAQWSVGWAFQFDISQYNSVGLDISKGYQDGFFEGDRFFLFALAYAVLFAYVAYNILRNKAAMALGELVASVVLVAFCSFLVANQGGYMKDTWRLMNEASASLLVAAEGRDPTQATSSDITTAVHSLQSQLHDVFVAQPYDHINWGRSLKGTPCEGARNQALDKGPHDNDDEPRDRMEDAGCDAEADFNADPSASRLGGAVLSMVASGFIATVLSGMGLTVVASKFVALLLFAMAPFIGLFAAFPGAGRRWGWLWLTTLVQAIVAVVGMSFLLSVLLIALRKTLEVTAQIGLVERYFIVIVLISLLSMARTRMLAGAQSTAGRFADNLTNVRMGGGGQQWQGPIGSSGVNLGGVGAAYTSLVGGAAIGLQRTVAQRMRERRAWHNIIKARRQGDRMAGLLHKTFYSDAPGGTHGPGPRYGYGNPASPGGGPDDGPGGPGGAVPEPESEFSPATHQVRLDRMSQRGRRPYEMANIAGGLGWHAERRYWGAIDAARRDYKATIDRGGDPTKARKRYNAAASAADRGYSRHTGQRPNVFAPPWTDRGEVSKKEMKATRRPEPPASGRRLIHEVIVQEQQASGWRFPVRNVTDKFSNWRLRGRGRKWAGKRNLR